MTTDGLDLEQALRADPGDAGCDAGVGILDAYVELELAGADPGQVYPGTRIHLQACEACRIDHDGLLELARLAGGAETAPAGD